MKNEQKAKNLYLLQENIVEAKRQLFILKQLYDCLASGEILGTTDYDLLNHKDNAVQYIIQAMNLVKPNKQFLIRNCLNLSLTLVRKYTQKLEVNNDIYILMEKQLENLLDNSRSIVTNI